MKSNRHLPRLARDSMAAAHESTDALQKPVPHGPRGGYYICADLLVEMDSLPSTAPAPRCVAGAFTFYFKMFCSK
ncbi:hypothetical protein CA51_22730 [Rosistilla oblonga]|nr:hypothetical protein CA51_22730 [Rosistilla oblonga]